MKEKIVDFVNEKGSASLAEIARAVNRRADDPELRQRLRELTDSLELL